MPRMVHRELLIGPGRHVRIRTASTYEAIPRTRLWNWQLSAEAQKVAAKLQRGIFSIPPRTELAISFFCPHTLRRRLHLVSIIKLGGFKNHPNGIVRLTCEDVIRLPMRHTALMRTSVSLYHRHRFPAEIISHSVWLYFRFALSFRDVEEMLAMRGGLLAMRRFENGVLRLVRPTLTAYAADLLDPGIDGTWMRYS